MWRGIKIPEFQTLLRQNIQRLEVCDDPGTNVTCKVEVLTKFLSDNAGQVFLANLNQVKIITQNPHPQISRSGSMKNVERQSKNLLKLEMHLQKPKVMKIELPLAICGLSITESVKMQSGGSKSGKRLESIAKSQSRKFWKSLKRGYNKPKI